jgi:hypothetical protein
MDASIPLDKMTIDEKLRAIEVIWEDLGMLTCFRQESSGFETANLSSQTGMKPSPGFGRKYDAGSDPR